MNEPLELNHPWLVAVWPGMGHVALNAGLYLRSKLNMTPLAELNAGDIFDVEGVEVRDGLIQPAQRPRTQAFVWKDPNQKHDIVLVIGEGQPPVGRLALCQRLVAFAKGLKVERVFTFAAMGTDAHPNAEARVFGVATDQANLDELKRLELKALDNGVIGGLNGVLLAVAAEAGVPGVGLLGEIPQTFAQVPMPKASLAILEAFTTLAGVDLDFTELSDYSQAIAKQLDDIIARAEQQYSEEANADADELAAADEPEEEEPEPPLPQAATPRQSSTRQAIEDLFDAATASRAKAIELKGELDRYGLFKEYEDRFLDLFKTAG